MTRTEIDDLIKELEKNYHVKCELAEVLEFSGEGLIITPTLPYKFLLNDGAIKQIIINKLDKLDLIRF